MSNTDPGWNVRSAVVELIAATAVPPVTDFTDDARLFWVGVDRRFT